MAREDTVDDELVCDECDRVSDAVGPCKECGKQVCELCASRAHEEEGGPMCRDCEDGKKPADDEEVEGVEEEETEDDELPDEDDLDEDLEDELDDEEIEDEEDEAELDEEDLDDEETEDEETDESAQLMLL